MTYKKKMGIIQKLYKNYIQDQDGFLRAAGINFFIKEDTVRTYWISLGKIPEAKMNLMFKFTIEFVETESKDTIKELKKYKEWI